MDTWDGRPLVPRLRLGTGVSGRALPAVCEAAPREQMSNEAEPREQVRYEAEPRNE
jgi:hypothetical protein